MAAPKLRIVYHENGKTQSYFHLERTEGLRVIEILKALKKIKEWTPVSEVARMNNIDPIVLRLTVMKLAGAKHIDLELNGQKKIIARSPVVLIKKNYTRKNTRHKYLRPTIYIKSHR